jgi:hypothetical protein
MVDVPLSEKVGFILGATIASTGRDVKIHSGGRNRKKGKLSFDLLRKNPFLCYNLGLGLS